MNTRAYGAELLGTFLFFAIGLGSVQAVGALGADAPLLVVVPLAFGLGLLAAIFAFPSPDQLPDRVSSLIRA